MISCDIFLIEKKPTKDGGEYSHWQTWNLNGVFKKPLKNFTIKNNIKNIEFSKPSNQGRRYKSDSQTICENGVNSIIFIFLVAGSKNNLRKKSVTVTSAIY